MLSTKKIEQAFEAICEEIGKVEKEECSESIQKALKTIRSIAKHQSDIRSSAKGSCKSSHS